MILRKQTDRSNKMRFFSSLLRWSFQGSWIVEDICCPAGLIKPGIIKLCPFGIQKSILGLELKLIGKVANKRDYFCNRKKNLKEARGACYNLVNTTPLLEHEIALEGKYKN